MRRWLAVLGVALALFLVIGKGASTIYAEWQWHAAMGVLAVYRSALMQQVAWRAGAACVAFTFALANLYALRRSIISLVLPRRLGNIEIGEAVSPRMLLAYVVGVSATLGVLLSAPTGDWTTMALARLAGPFREFDPFLDRDLAYAIAQLPFELDVYAWAGRVMIVIAGLIVALYALTPSLRVRRGGFYISVYCRRHLAVLAALVLLLIAWRWRLDGLSLTSITPDGGGPYNAYWHRVGGPLLAWLAALTAVAAFIVAWTGWNGYGRAAAFTAVLAAVGGPGIVGMLPRLTARTLAESTLREEDRPYATTRRLFTRRAYGVDAIDTVPAAGMLAPTAADATSGVPVWDPAAMARALAGPAFDPDSAVVAWVPAASGMEALVLARRAAASPEWTAFALDASAVGAGGRVLPAMARDGPAAPPPGWTRVLVFPGASLPLVVADTGGHLPAPAFTDWWRRVALAWAVRMPRLVGTDPGGMRPRLAFHRDVRDRVHEVAPFLTVGPTIMPLVRGDSLYWVAELFTTSVTYPLADHLFFAGREFAYVHHAATAYVQALTGAVTLVATSQPDAIMRTWMRRFPGLFVTEASLAGAIAAAHAPIVDWAMLQATALARTGAPGAGTAARAAVGADNVDADLTFAAPTLMTVGHGATLAWSAPVIDAAGYVKGAVLATGGNHPATFWIRSRREDRWADILDGLQRAADSAGLGRQRANALRGRVLTVPFANGLAFTQSHYERGAGGAPVLSGASAFANGAAKAGATPQDALGVPRDRRRDTPAQFRADVDALYRRMDAALQRRDWAAFGAAFSALGRLVRDGRNP